MASTPSHRPATSRLAVAPASVATQWALGIQFFSGTLLVVFLAGDRSSVAHVLALGPPVWSCQGMAAGWLRRSGRRIQTLFAPERHQMRVVIFFTYVVSSCRTSWVARLSLHPGGITSLSMRRKLIPCAVPVFFPAIFSGGEKRPEKRRLLMPYSPLAAPRSRNSAGSRSVTRRPP